MTVMTTWGFTARLNREPIDEELDLLYEAGCDDSAPEGALLHFDREADTLFHAVVSASRDVSAVPGLWVTGVTRDDIVSLREIASRLDRTYESARLLVEGKRGPGSFPSPVIDIGFTKLYLWVEVEEWAHGPLGLQALPPAESERDLALADAVLTLRNRLASASRSQRKEILELIAA